MEHVTLYPIMHRGAEQILIQYKNLKELNTIVRKLKGVKWSQTHKSWYLPLNRENYNVIFEALHKAAEINLDELKKYLLKKSCRQGKHHQISFLADRSTKTCSGTASCPGSTTAADGCL